MRTSIVNGARTQKTLKRKTYAGPVSFNTLDKMIIIIFIALKLINNFDVLHLEHSIERRSKTENIIILIEHQYIQIVRSSIRLLITYGMWAHVKFN